jgi:hypothetical protein
VTSRQARANATSSAATAAFDDAASRRCRVFPRPVRPQHSGSRASRPKTARSRGVVTPHRLVFRRNLDACSHRTGSQCRMTFRNLGNRDSNVSPCGKFRAGSCHFQASAYTWRSWHASCSQLGHYGSVGSYHPLDNRRSGTWWLVIATVFGGQPLPQAAEVRRRECALRVTFCNSSRTA